MRNSQRTPLLAALIFMAVPSASRAGTLSPDDHGNIPGISIDETHGAIHRIGGIDPIHIRFDITDATSLKSAGFELHNFRLAGATRSVPEPTSLSLIALAGIGYVARFLRRRRSCLVKS